MLAVERRNLIIEKLHQEKRVVVSDLSRLFSVSEETIRRDLDKMEQDGLLIKSYGGAILNESTSIDLPFNVRKNRNVAGKQIIADLVSGLISEGERIMLDASTTSVFIAKALKQKEQLTVITNSIENLIELSDKNTWNIISVGGTLKGDYLAMVGPKAEEGLRDYRADKALISCKALQPELGCFDSSDEFSCVKRAMIRASKEVILAVDHSKFEQESFSKICELREVSMIVTDRKPSEQWLTRFEKAGVNCIYPR
ncbi:MAG: DeoR/GlpR family DNA-binding transcription regulator [Eubacteriales bacterium]|nr:DeoR/GlpR family DNA-binding transcription regulator [Eubacteriales bacterium]